MSTTIEPESPQASAGAPGSRIREPLLTAYRQQLREVLILWAVAPEVILEITSEIESHIAEGRNANRSAADILKGLGPVDQLAEAYALALLIDGPESSNSSWVQKLCNNLGRGIWFCSMLLVFSILGIFGVSTLAAGAVGLVAGMLLPMLPPEVMEPTLRTGLPQLVLLLVSCLSLIIGWQCLRWLRTNVYMARTALWRRKKIRQGKQTDYQALDAGVGLEAPTNSKCRDKPEVALRLVSPKQVRQAALETKTGLIVGVLLGWSMLSGIEVKAGELILERDIVVGGQTGLELVMGNGSANIEPSADSNIHVRLEIEPRRMTNDGDNAGFLSWFLSRRLDDEAALMQAISIQVIEGERRILVRPTPRGRSRESRVEESWTIQLPRDFSVELSAQAAEVNVLGISGGLTVEQGYGEIRASVPSGDLNLNLEVGNIYVSSASQDWQRLSLESAVGDIGAWVDGRAMRFSKPPGPGNQVTLEGRGTDNLRLRVKVGDAEIRFDQRSD